MSGVSLRASSTNPQVLNPRDHRVEIQLLSKGDQLVERLRDKLGAEAVPADAALRVEWVGPKAGKQLRDSARNAIAIAIVFIMLYLAFRFDLRFAPGVIVAVRPRRDGASSACSSCFHKEITLSTIAAVITVIGYSMNDTVVVYDRIRENLGRHRGKSFAQIINMSVSETLSRTILTSGRDPAQLRGVLHLRHGHHQRLHVRPRRRDHRRHVLEHLRRRSAHRVDRQAHGEVGPSKKKSSRA